MNSSEHLASLHHHDSSCSSSSPPPLIPLESLLPLESYNAQSNQQPLPPQPPQPSLPSSPHSVSTNMKLALEGICQNYHHGVKVFEEMLRTLRIQIEHNSREQQQQMNNFGGHLNMQQNNDDDDDETQQQLAYFESIIRAVERNVTNWQSQYQSALYHNHHQQQQQQHHHHHYNGTVYCPPNGSSSSVQVVTNPVYSLSTDISTESSNQSNQSSATYHTVGQLVLSPSSDSAEMNPFRFSTSLNDSTIQAIQPSGQFLGTFNQLEHVPSDSSTSSSSVIILNQYDAMNDHEATASTTGVSQPTSGYYVLDDTSNNLVMMDNSGGGGGVSTFTTATILNDISNVTNLNGYVTIDSTSFQQQQQTSGVGGTLMAHEHTIETDELSRLFDETIMSHQTDELEQTQHHQVPSLSYDDPNLLLMSNQHLQTQQQQQQQHLQPSTSSHISYFPEVMHQHQHHHQHHHQQQTELHSSITSVSSILSEALTAASLNVQSPLIQPDPQYIMTTELTNPFLTSYAQQFAQQQQQQQHQQQQHQQQHQQQPTTLHDV